MVISAFMAFKVFTGYMNSKNGRAVPANGGAAGVATPENAKILYSSRYWAGLATNSSGEEGGYYRHDGQNRETNKRFRFNEEGMFPGRDYGCRLGLRHKSGWRRTVIPQSA